MQHFSRGKVAIFLEKSSVGAYLTDMCISHTVADGRLIFTYVYPYRTKSATGEFQATRCMRGGDIPGLVKIHFPCSGSRQKRIPTGYLSRPLHSTHKITLIQPVRSKFWSGYTIPNFLFPNFPIQNRLKLQTLVRKSVSEHHILHVQRVRFII